MQPSPFQITSSEVPLYINTSSNIRRPKEIIQCWFKCIFFPFLPFFPLFFLSFYSSYKLGWISTGRFHCLIIKYYISSAYFKTIHFNDESESFSFQYNKAREVYAFILRNQYTLLNMLNVNNISNVI